jgi:hypothetical protein
VDYQRDYMYQNEVYPIKKRSLRNFKFTRKKESLRNLKNHLQKKRKLGKRHLGIHDHLHQIFYFYNTLYFFYLLKCHLLRTSLNFNHHCDDGFFGLIIYFSIYFYKKKHLTNTIKIFLNHMSTLKHSKITQKVKINRMKKNLNGT